MMAARYSTNRFSKMLLLRISPTPRIVIPYSRHVQEVIETYQSKFLEYMNFYIKIGSKFLFLDCLFNFLAGCPKSIMISNDNTMEINDYIFGVYNLIRYDENHEAEYEHISPRNNHYRLKRATFEPRTVNPQELKIQGWFVSIH